MSLRASDVGLLISEYNRGRCEKPQNLGRWKETSNPVDNVVTIETPRINIAGPLDEYSTVVKHLRDVPKLIWIGRYRLEQLYHQINEF
jgi:hypothetical protein